MFTLKCHKANGDKLFVQCKSFDYDSRINSLVYIADDGDTICRIPLTDNEDIGFIKAYVMNCKGSTVGVFTPTRN